MKIKYETWELIVEGLEAKIDLLNEEIHTQKETYEYQRDNLNQLRKDFVTKCEEIAELKLKLREYEKRNEIEQFISKMGRRYVEEKINYTWFSKMMELFPSADLNEYQKKGRAKQMIIDMLRSGVLRFHDNGTIFKV